jgi:hypothetical protein
MPTNYPAPTEAIQAVYNRAINLLLRSYPVKDSPLNIRPVRSCWTIEVGDKEREQRMRGCSYHRRWSLSRLHGSSY